MDGITRFPKGSNITLLNTYYKRFRDESDGKFKDLMVLVYKDLDTGLKYKEEILQPEMEYYTALPDKRTSYNRLFIPETDAEKHTCTKLGLEKDICKSLGLSNWYNECMNAQDRESVRQIHTHPDVFGSDINIEDFYRQQFALNYVNADFVPTKAYFDIEVDGRDMVGDFPQPGECPINAITIIMEETMTVFTLALRNSQNPQILEFEKFLMTDGCQDLKKFVIDHVNTQDPELAKKYHLDLFNYQAIFYDEENEIDLIRDLFNIINQYQPDFALAWNMSFDIPYIIARIEKLGYHPADIMCHPDFKYRYAEYFVDERNKNEFGERGDFAVISSYTVFLDQLIQFASRRKSQTRLLSYSLDFVGDFVARVCKLDYKMITGDLMQLPYINYRIFYYYNVCDTIVQHCIECVTEDIDFVLSKALMNNTRYSKVHRQTVYLVNRGRKEFYASDNVIMGNNFNKNNDKPTTKFSGAFVANPEQLSDYSKLKLNGKAINVFDNLYDSDYASLYPNLINQFNIAANTQIGKLVIPGDPNPWENRRHSESYDRGGAFFEDLHTHNWIIVGAKWFNLPGVKAMYDYVINYFNHVCQPSDMIGFEAGPRQYSQPIVWEDDRTVYGWNPIIFNPPMPEEGIKEFLNHVAVSPNQRF